MGQYFRTDTSTCTFLSTAFILTVSVKKYETAAYIRMYGAIRKFYQSYFLPHRL